MASFLGACVSLAVVSPVSAEENDRARLIDRILATADPKLMEVVVTERVGDGKPSFTKIKVTNMAEARRVIDGLLGRPGVRSVEMNQTVSVEPVRKRDFKPATTPQTYWNDPYFYGYQWALDPNHLKFDAIATITRRDTARPYVAVVDTGVQGNHPDLSSHMISGYDAINDVATGKSDYNDVCGHGTHVAGIIAAGANNGIGVIGMAPRAFIRSVKVLDWDGYECSGGNYDIAWGILWAADHANVINLSLGSTFYSEAVAEAVQYAVSRGRVVVAAAGNCDPYCKSKVYPAALSGVVGVAAIDKSRRRAWFSSYGWWVDVAAPGEEILSTFPDQAYAYLSGTSMAAPHVAAAAVLGIQHCRWGASRTVSKMFSTASHPARKDKVTGYGIIRPVTMLRC